MRCNGVVASIVGVDRWLSSLGWSQGPIGPWAMNGVMPQRAIRRSPEEVVPGELTLSLDDMVLVGARVSEFRT